MRVRVKSENLYKGSGMAFDRQQINITLSKVVYEDFKIQAEWQGTPIAALLRQIIETHWNSPAAQQLIRRAKTESSQANDQDDQSVIKN